MKKIVWLCMTFCFFFQLFMLPVAALSNEECKQEILAYKEELKTLVDNTTFPLFTSLLDNTISFNEDEIFQLFDYISNHQYEQAYDFMMNKVSDKTAWNTLKNSFLNEIDALEDYEKRLYTFLDTNKANILVSDMFPLLDQVQSSYHTLRTSFKKIFAFSYDSNYSMMKEKLEQYSQESVSNLKQDLTTEYDKMMQYETYLLSLQDRLLSWKQLLSTLNLDGLGYEEEFIEDIKPYVTKMKETYQKYYQEFVDRQWNELKQEGNAIIQDSMKSVKEKNTLLLEKIDLFTSFKQDATTKFTDVKNKMKIHRIVDKFEKIEKNVFEECDKAIEYVRSLLLTEDYAIVLKNGASSFITLDAQNRYLITRNEYTLTQFMNLLQVKDAGELGAGTVYNNYIGTKSTVGVYEGNTAMVLYHIILKGDIRANGIIDVSDVTYLIKTVLNNDTLDTYETLAADMNDDGKLDISDITATIKKALE